MKLIKLDQNTISLLQEKKIICYVKVVAYIQEINLKYGILPNIECIVDENVRNIGSCICEGITIPVYDIEYLSHVNWETHIILITSEYYKEVFETLLTIDKVCSCNDFVLYYEDLDTMYYEYYLSKYDGKNLENIIVFRSGPRNERCSKWMEFTDNAKALFDYMIQHDYHKKYRLVWIVKNPNDYQEVLDTYDNVDFISYDWSISEDKNKREIYYYYICLAKYFFFTEACSFIRNKRYGQIRIQLWHGQGFKGRAVTVKSEEKRYEYMPVISKLYSHIHQNIFGIREEQILITGIPKQDWVLKPIDENILLEMNIPNNKKIIFWLPTFRESSAVSIINEVPIDSETGLPLVDTFGKLRCLNDMLKEKNTVLIIKLHPLQKELPISNYSSSNILILDNEKLNQKFLHINQILSCSHALISDCSSIIVDYLLLDKPIAIAFDDFEVYKQKRGFVFDDVADWLPGNIIDSFENFCSFIKDIQNDIDVSAAKRKKIAEKMFIWKDDKSCQRILEILKILP